MLTFEYNKKIELLVFNEYVEKRKAKPVKDALKRELKSVKILPDDNLLISQLTYISKEWENVSSLFLKALGDFYEETLTIPPLTCYLTRLTIFPYDYSGEKKWFTAPLFSDPTERNRVIMHELCHFFQPTELPREIKEAIPVILNDHEKFNMFSIERGGADPEEQKWRKVIWDLYKEGKTYKDLIKVVTSSL